MRTLRGHHGLAMQMYYGGTQASG